MALSKLTVLNDKYVLRKVLGSQGPYDITYLAWNLSKERNAVVIREYNPSFIVTRSGDGTQFTFEDKASREDFEYGQNCFVREAAAAALIDHPNIVRHEDYFRENETSYCVSTFHSGATLEKVLEGKLGKIEKRAAYAIIMPLLDGLVAGHRQGLIHGRISPAQIFLTKTGRPMLFRFHVTRLLLGRRCSRVLDMNIEGYTPPELLVPNGKKGPWSDVYSCGATLYSIITGKTPPDALSRMEKDPFLDVLHQETEIQPGLKKVLYRATSMDPEERPPSILEFKQDLMNAMLSSGREFGPRLRDPGEVNTSYPVKNEDPSVPDFTAEDTIPGVFHDSSYAPPEPVEKPEFYGPDEEEYNQGGDGYASKKPAREPYLDVPRSGAGREFVETNPLGPFANERLFMDQPPSQSSLQKAKVFPEVGLKQERVQLQKPRSSMRIPVLTVVALLVAMATIWGVANSFVQVGGSGSDGTPPPERTEMQVVLPAAAGQGIVPDANSPDSTVVADSAIVSPDNELQPAIGLVETEPIVASIDSFSIGQLRIQQADSLLAAQQLKEAQEAYQEALVFLPTDAYADSMLRAVTRTYDEELRSQRFQRYMRQAQFFENEERFLEAVQLYQRALAIRPGEPLALRRLDAIQGLMEAQKDNDQKYQYFIGQGDALMALGNFGSAIESFEKARLLRPDDEYTTQQIAAAHDSLKVVELESQQQQSLYAFHRSQADSFYEASDLNNAFVQYRAALAQNPSDEYVLDRLVSIEQTRKENIARITDSRGIFIVTDTPPKLLDEYKLVQQIEYPRLAEKLNVEGRVIIRMIVNEDGSISEPEVLRGIGHGCDQEALRVLREVSFNPARHEGKVVRSWHTHSITFKLLR